MTNNKIAKMRVAFNSARYRCSNKHSASYALYGGRGIKFLFTGFDQFLTVLGDEWFDGASLDRIDSNGNYEPSNCRWATQKEQQRNRRNNVKVSYNGEARLLVEVVESIGISYFAVVQRLRRGWSVDDALSKPIASRCIE